MVVCVETFGLIIFVNANLLLLGVTVLQVKIFNKIFIALKEQFYVKITETLIHKNV